MEMNQLCEQFDFKQKLSMHNASANGLVVTFNKTLGNLPKNVINHSKKLYGLIKLHNWTPTQATPYNLVYGVELVLPLKQQILTLRIVIQERLFSENNMHL